MPKIDEIARVQDARLVLVGDSEQAGLDRFFDRLISIDGAGAYEPSPRCYARLTDTLALAPEQVLFVSAPHSVLPPRRVDRPSIDRLEWALRAVPQAPLTPCRWVGLTAKTRVAAPAVPPARSRRGTLNGPTVLALERDHGCGLVTVPWLRR